MTAQDRIIRVFNLEQTVEGWVFVTESDQPHEALDDRRRISWLTHPASSCAIDVAAIPVISTAPDRCCRQEPTSTPADARREDLNGPGAK